MSVEEKYKDANENQQAIDLLPEIVTFLASIASADNHTYTAEQTAAALAELADSAENLKFRMGYGY
jgi:hypothetical protein